MDSQTRIYESSNSFKSYLEGIKELFYYYWRKKWIIIPVTLLGGILLGFYALKSAPTYKAQFTFMVKEDEGGNFDGLMSMLGNLGIGGGSRSKYNLDKVVGLARSERIVNRAILDTVTVNNQSDILGNIIVSHNDLKDKWQKSGGVIQGFNNFSGDDSLNIPERAALKSLYGLVAGPTNKNRLLNVSFDKDNTIISLVVVSDSEDISFLLANSIYKELATFYIRQSTEKAQSTVDNLEKKLAVLEGRLMDRESRVASTRDNTLGLYLEQDNLPEMRLSRDVQINSLLYSELVRNLENARFSLDNATPVFQVIDQPFYPLIPIAKSPVIFGILGCILFGGLSLVALYVLKLAK